MLFLAAFFVFAVLGDVVTILWHDAREQRRYGRFVGLSAAFEVLGWIPLWFAFTRQDWRIAAVSIVGSVIGATFGLWWVSGHESGHGGRIETTVNIESADPASFRPSGFHPVDAEPPPRDNAPLGPAD